MVVDGGRLVLYGLEAVDNRPLVFPSEAHGVPSFVLSFLRGSAWCCFHGGYRGSLSSRHRTILFLACDGLCNPVTGTQLFKWRGLLPFPLHYRGKLRGMCTV